MQNISREIRKRTRGNPFVRIAFWQSLVFVMLFCLVWICELLDLPATYFNIPSEQPNIFRGMVLSVAILICAFVMIGNTYVQQRRIVHGLLTVCSFCGRIRIAADVWEQMESYFYKRSLAAFSHGICPDCLSKLESTDDDTPKDRPGTPSVR